jgi:hypothetical protein
MLNEPHRRETHGDKARQWRRLQESAVDRLEFCQQMQSALELDRETRVRVTIGRK